MTQSNAPTGPRSGDTPGGSGSGGGHLIGSEGGDPSSPRPAASLALLQRVLEPVRNVLVYSHMNPDPDTIGAAVGLRLLLEHLGKNCLVAYRGMIGRAENKKLLELAAPEIRSARDVDQSRFDGAFLVDAQPSFGFDEKLDRLPLLGIIDHHPLVGPLPAVPFCDIRPHYGSTCTIVAEYLMEAGIEPSRAAATALFYGLKTDTRDLTRRASPADERVYEWLVTRVDRSLLTRIENPPLTRAYFDGVAAGVSRAIVYQSTLLTELGPMPYPDMVAQIADNLARLEGLQWIVCFGMHEHRVYFSVRNAGPTRNAGEVVRRVLADSGVGGGHDTMAAGRVQLVEDSEDAYLRIVAQLWSRFLEVLGEDPLRGRRFVRDDPGPPRVLSSS